MQFTAQNIYISSRSKSRNLSGFGKPLVICFISSYPKRRLSSLWCSREIKLSQFLDTIWSWNNLHWRFKCPRSLQSSQGWRKNYIFQHNHLASLATFSFLNIYASYKIYLPFLVCKCIPNSLRKNWNASKKHCCPDLCNHH